MKTVNLNHELELIRNEQMDMEPYKRNMKYYLLSITLGEDDYELTSGIKEKLLEKMHWENAVHFLHVQKELEDKKQVDAAMDQFIGDAASGMLSLLNRYYIPMIVNMKSVSVDTIVKLTKYIDETLRQKGCNDYEIGYYLVYDQEISKEEQKQITGNLLDLTRKNSIGFFGQNVEEAYAHVIRAIAMDIFLKLCGEERPYQVYTLGYWKYDVVKQRLAAYLDALLQKQKVHQDEIDILKEIRRCLREYVYADLENKKQEWFDKFSKMPFRINGLEEEGKVTYRELLKMMYGTETVFHDFLEDNFAIENVEQTARNVMNYQECSLYDIEHGIINACDEVKCEYSEEIEKGVPRALESIATLKWERTFLGFRKMIQFESCIQRLQQDIWSIEAKKFALEQTCRILDYLKSEVFRKYINEKKEEYTEIERQIKLIYRESCLVGNDYGLKSINEEYNNCPKRLCWNDSIWKEDFWKKIKNLVVPVIKAVVEKWGWQEYEQQIWEFQRKLKNLEERDVYYAAKLPLEWDIEKEKKIYIASQENEINVENIRTVWWEPQGCFELVDYREIKGDGC